MWRAEENIFARARPARLDTQYSSTGACTTAPPARTLMPPRWFHVPGSGARDAQGPPEGLVTSTHLSSSLLLQRSSLLDHGGTADASAHALGWGGRDADGNCWGIAGPSPAMQPQQPFAPHGGAGTRDTRSLGSLLCHTDLRPTRDTSADNTSPTEVSRLLRQYRDENARLREQLKAKELHEAHIMARLEETSHRCAHLQLAWQRASGDTPSSLLQSAGDKADAAQSVGSHGGEAEETVQSRLAQKEAEVRELQGRVEAYREALQRSRAHAAPLSLRSGTTRRAQKTTTTTMAGLDVAWIPFTVMYLLYLIPPTLMEVYSYYSRGGLVRYEDLKYDDSFCPQYQWNRDTEVYYKRFLDRPTSEAGKAFFSWLDWSSESYDRTIYILRRNLAKQDGEVSPWWRYVYGPFIFNWPKKTWLRGDDAACRKAPAWGVGGDSFAVFLFAFSLALDDDGHLSP